MKFTILLSSAILFATALTPISAYADDSNLKCRRMANGCDTRNNGGSERISISGFDIEVKSSDRGNRNRNTVDRTNDSIGNGNDDTVSAAGADHPDTDDTDNTDAGNENSGNDNADNDNADDGDNNAGSDNTDTGASNNSPPQSNSNDIKGFDPFGGLYGPGT